MIRERHKLGGEADSTDASHRGGQPRSSCEAAVMDVEPRGLADELEPKAIRDTEDACLASVQESQSKRWSTRN